MAIAYYGTTISPHMDVTPEGFLICRDVPIARTGTQNYFAREMMLDGDPERIVTVDRRPEDVFEAATLASFEGKPVTDGHPPENVGPENYAAYTRGHVQNVRRAGDFIVADLYINDSSLASEVENRVKREVSCGYTCNYVPDGSGYRQTNIRGNHVAVVPAGRAGHDVAIQDSAPEAEKGRKSMTEFWKSVLTAFGKAAKDASPEELDEMVVTTATALDAAPAAPVQDAAPEAEPAKAEDEMVEKAPKGDDLGSKLDRIIRMLEAQSRGGRVEKPIHDEDPDLDDMIEKLGGGKKDPEAATTVPADKADDGCMGGGMSKDEALRFYTAMRPTVKKIQDEATRKMVSDAIIGYATGSLENPVGKIVQAAQDSARSASEASRRTDYEKICADAESAYAARNPHKKKEA